MDIKNIYERMRNGDSITDKEVLFAFGKFNDLASRLGELGDVFHLARVEAIQRTNQLRDWYQSRTGEDLYE